MKLIEMRFLHLSILLLLDSVSAFSHEESSGPRFLEEWSSSPTHYFSAKAGTTLRCRVHGEPRPSVEWLDARELTPVANISGLREVDASSGSLYFAPFPPEQFRAEIHSNSYICRATNPSGVIVSPELAVRAVVDSPFEVEVEDVAAIRGNTAILRCLLPKQLSSFVSVASWVQDGVVNIYPNFQTGKWLMAPTGELYIFNVDKADGRKSFSCRTLNSLTNESTRSKSVRIIVKEGEGPLGVRMLVGKAEEAVSVGLGSPVFLSCLAEGSPPPNYTWFREIEGVLVPEHFATFSSSKGRQEGGLIHLPSARLEHAGEYICRANNSHSADQAVISLSVTVPLRVQVAPSSQIVDVGRGAMLRCLVSGTARTITWYKDGERVNGKGTSKETLKLPSVRPQDAGMYQCMACNSQEKCAQDSAQIRLGSILPELIYRFSEQTIQPGPSVSLKCTAVGNPPPQFVWTLDGWPLPENERYLVGQYVTIHDNVISHVNISQTRDEDGGLYSCTARNAMGFVSHSARLSIYGPPFVRAVPPVKAVAGKGLLLQCPVSGYPIESITWEKGGALLPVTRSQRVHPNGSLSIDLVQKGDEEGGLRCIAKGRGGQTSSRDIQLRIVVPPRIVPFQFMNSVLREGLRAAVSCQLLEGDRPVDLVWEFEGRPLSTFSNANSGINIRIPDEYSSTLVIDSLSPAHNGEYKCIAENGGGKDSVASVLVIQVPPKFTLEPSDVAVAAGTRVTIPCQAVGHPPPTITWRRGVGSGDYKDMPPNSMLPNGSLKFDPIRKGDEGAYLCEAISSSVPGGSTPLSKLIYVKVNAPAAFLPSDREQVLSFRAGEKGLLQCRAKGDSPLSIVWGNKHSKLGPHSNHRYSQRENEIEGGLLSELSISSVDRSDGGTYSCKGTNAFGSDHATLVVNVLEAPEQPVNLRVLEVSSRSVHISWLENFNGNSPLLNFILQSKFPSETWTEAEVEELTVPGSQSSAVLEGLSPSTTYQLRVLAQNGVGFSPPSESVQLSTAEEAPEGPPLELAAEAVSSTKLKLRWAPPERTLWHGTILGYYLGYRELPLGEEDSGTNVHSHYNSGELAGYHFKTVEISPDFGGTAELENLKKFTRYALLVQAFNAKGPGPSSSPLFATTLQDVPTLSPEKVLCASSSPQSLRLTWDPPPLEGRHGLIQGYVLSYVRMDPEGHPADEEGPGSKVTGERELVLHGLKKYANYSFTLKAFTAVGEGVEGSPTICATDEDVPSPPAEVKGVVSSRRSILLTWLPPVDPNGRVIRYNAYLRTLDGAKVEKKSVGGDERSFEWGGLKESTGYEFWISAVTRVGEGSPTPRGKITTTNKVGGRIGSFGGVVSVGWKRELVLECLAVGVPEPNIQWSHKGGFIQSGGRREMISGSTGGYLKLSDVTPDDAGRYNCSCSNVHGSDVISYDLKVLLPPQSPSLKLGPPTASSIPLSWSTPGDGGSSIKGYSLNWRRAEEGEWEELPLNKNKNSHTLSPLLCGTNYQLFVTARNKIGSGLPSEILSKATLGAAPSAPRKEDLFAPHPANHSLTLRLSSWRGAKGVCPILRFMIEYKKTGERSWSRIPNELAGETQFYTLTGLAPSSKYEVRIKSGWDGGESVGSYEFSTSSEPQQTNGAGAAVGGADEEDSSSSTSLLILFPSFLSILAVTGLLGFVCYIRRKRLDVNGPKTVIGDTPDIFHGQGHFLQDPSGTLVRRSQPFVPVQSQTLRYGTLQKHGNERGAGYVDDVCPYATFQLPEAPPGRPLLTKGQGTLSYGHSGDTLYNVGNVYSGPYHSVQSPNFLYSQATLPLRRDAVEEEDDAEVKKILSLHHHQLGDELDMDYDTLDQVPHPHNLTASRHGHQGQILTSFRHRVPSDATSDHSTSSTEGSSPTRAAGRKRASYTSRKSKSSSSSAKASGRVRSSSGYSSHTEETSFSYSAQGQIQNQGQIQPPSRFSDEVPPNEQDMNKYPSNKRFHNKRSFAQQKSRDGFHIDV